MTNGGPEVAPTNIDALRARDSRDKNLAPEKETLNDKRVLDFLSRADNKVGFNFEKSIQLLDEGKTSTEAVISSKLKEARGIMQKYDSVAKMDEDKVVLTSQLENMKTPPVNMTDAEAKKVLEAKEYFDVIKDHALRLQNVMQASTNERKEIFGGKKSLTETAKDLLGGAMDNWDKLSTGKKLAMAGIAFVGGIIFLKSENEHVKSIRSGLMTGLKIAGGAWLFNNAWYLFSGETFFDFAKGKIQGTKGSDFLKQAYGVDDKGAELMTKSFVHMGESPFIGLLDQYETSQDSTINGTRMPPGEAYQAIGIFIKKYGAKRLRDTYSKYNPPISYSQVSIIEMSNDPDVKMKEALTKRVTGAVGDWFKRSYNYVASSAPAVWMSKKYKDWFGKEPTQQELQDFSKKFGEMVTEENEVNGAINSRLLRNEPQVAKNYIDTNLSGRVDSKYGLKYRVAADGYVYMIVEKSLSNVNGDEKVLDQTIQSSIETAENFLVEQYKADKSTVSGKCQPHGTIFVANTTSLKYLVRYKKS